MASKKTDKSEPKIKFSGPTLDLVGDILGELGESAAISDMIVRDAPDDYEAIVGFLAERTPEETSKIFLDDSRGRIIAVEFFTSVFEAIQSGLEENADVLNPDDDEDSEEEDVEED